MSQQNVEVVRQICEGINRKDVTAIQAACDPDVEVTSRFEGKTYRGYASALDYLADLWATWADHRVTTEEFIPAGENELVVALRVTGVGRESGVPFDQRTFGVLKFRHGKALRARWYSGREEALQAAGLTE